MRIGRQRYGIFKFNNQIGKNYFDDYFLPSANIVFSIYKVLGNDEAIAILTIRHYI